MYYLKKFHTYDELKEAVCDYIGTTIITGIKNA